MATIHFKQTTTSTPEQFVAAVTDFGPGRQELFGNSADGYLKVHDQGPGHADVTEGSAGVWERLNYDWSDPDRIVMTTTDSNLWGGASGHTYTFTRNADGRRTWTPSWSAERKRLPTWSARKGGLVRSMIDGRRDRIQLWLFASSARTMAAQRGGGHVTVAVRDLSEPS
jgi:hypothetical protein